MTLTRSLNLRWVSDAEWVEALQEKLADGGCAAVICSTVGRAQEVFQRLQDKFAKDELGLFHGRFLFCDRERIEQDCIAKFGKPSDSETQRPPRYVLVATQVIEQSLDLDFDVMISDLAPIDLLLQRSGRLHRHADRKIRPIKLEKPTLWVVQPTIDPSGKVQFAETGIIYNRHILLRTWLTLRDQICIQLPEETDALIEAVYELDAPIPKNLEAVHQTDWQDSLDDYQGEEGETRKKITLANAVKLPPAIAESHPYDFTRQGEIDDDNAIAKVTRLGDPTVTTIFLQQTPAGLTFPGQSIPINLNQPPDLPQIREFLAHSTRIGKRGLVQALLAQENPKSWTSALLKYCRYVVLNPEGAVQVGQWVLELDQQRGIVIEKAK